MRLGESDGDPLRSASLRDASLPAAGSAETSSRRGAACAPARGGPLVRADGGGCPPPGHEASRADLIRSAFSRNARCCKHRAVPTASAEGSSPAARSGHDFGVVSQACGYPLSDLWAAARAPAPMRARAIPIARHCARRTGRARSRAGPTRPRDGGDLRGARDRIRPRAIAHRTWVLLPRHFPNHERPGASTTAVHGGVTAGLGL